MSLAMLRYKISTVPVPPSPSHIANYTAFRLLSLRTDPTAFGSSYEREIAFTPEQWRKGLDGVNKFVIVASTVPCDHDRHKSEWVGMVTIVASSELGGWLVLPEVAEDTLVYGLFGTRVHPGHRRQGLAKRMIELGFDWVRTHRHPSQNDAKGDMEKVVVLGVEESNENARALYRKTGFEPLSSVESQPGEGLPMIAKVRCDDRLTRNNISDKDKSLICPKAVHKYPTFHQDSRILQSSRTLLIQDVPSGPSKQLYFQPIR
jgi:ribosomal protein S18 acetylase RimI-like enzyme